MGTTSVNDILKIVDITKGTFYYYFASKEEVLAAIILDIVEEGAKRAEQILKDKSVPLINRIMMAIMAQSRSLKDQRRSGTKCTRSTMPNWNSYMQNHAQADDPAAGSSGSRRA